METFEPFDLKITKLTGNRWDRFDHCHLAEQLMLEQGNARHSIENRVIVCFDRSPTSTVAFFEKNKELILDRLIRAAYNPYEYTYWLNTFDCWVLILFIKLGEYQLDGNGDYYEHPIGLGLREKEKANFERTLIVEVSPLCAYRIRPNRINPLAIGIDGELKIDSKKIITIKPKQLDLFTNPLFSAALPPGGAHNYRNGAGGLEQAAGPGKVRDEYQDIF